MRLKKFMHPRNKYKEEEPDFKQLAVLYPEFRNVAVTELSGKVRLNFKDEETLRVLAKTLLNHDFGLEVEIPQMKLIPAMPLRLNYTLWIEDLLHHAGLSDMKAVHGVDIGTGAVCIYPLLFAKLYGCKMTSSEVDPQSVKSANDNIKRNKLQDLIKVVSVLKETILAELLDDNEDYSFVMCNPPFFKTEGDSEKTPKRLPPRNAPTGNESELVVEGGEIAFIMRLIDDSILLRERVQIYTTMIGLKTSLSFLQSELKNRNIENATWTEFCQGFTKRWGLAWTFLPTNILDLSTAPTIRMKPEILERKKRERPPFEIIFPPHRKFGTVQDVVAALKSSLRDLNIEAKELNLEGKEHPYWAGKLRAYEDSWSHSRKRRREFLQKEDSVKKARREEENKIEAGSFDRVTFPENTYGFRHCQSKEPLLVFVLVIDAVQTENKSQEVNGKQFRISMIFERGTGGKNSLETFRQFLLNKLHVREYFQEQFKNKRKKGKICS